MTMDQVLAGCWEPRPLILRANAGDWLEVTLYNVFNPQNPIPYYDYPRVPLDRKHTPSSRVSLNPQFLEYDPVSDSGINVGYNNREQTVGIGESKKYLWRADREYGACILQSFGDMRNHRYHGSGSLKWDVESGMWGIFRVIRQGIGCRCENACKRAACYFKKK